MTLVSLWALILVLLIDVGLSTDNAAVNAGIVRGFPKVMQNKVMIVGMLMAIVMRIILLGAASYLYELPFLKFIGGIWIVLMAVKMFADADEEDEAKVINAKGLLKAGLMLAFADLTMSLDNVLALIAAANGELWVVIVGVIISIPLLFLATKGIVALVEKYPKLNYIFAAILAFVGVKMMFEDSKNLVKFFNWVQTIPSWESAIGGAILVVAAGIWINRRENKARHEADDVDASL